LLNGPPGVGKSTCARRWVAAQATAVVVEIDDLRTSIDGWQDDARSKQEARQMAIHVAAAHLREGSDVMVPQYLGRIDFINELEGTARAAGAAFAEMLLHADVDEIVARFEARRAEAAGPAHPEHEIEDVRGAVVDAIARLESIAGERSGTLTIPAHDNPEVTLARLTAILSR
jgi:predicted kinase